MSRKQYINRRPQTTLEQIVDDVAYLTNSLNVAGVLNNNTRFGKIPVTGAGALAKVEADPLLNRHSVYVVNDSSFIIFIAETQDAPQNQRLALPSGSSLEFSLNPSIVTPIWIFSPFFDLNIDVIEVA